MPCHATCFSPVSRYLRNALRWRGRNRSGMISVSSWPKSSSWEYPKSFAAASFMYWIRLLSSIVRMPSAIVAATVRKPLSLPRAASTAWVRSSFARPRPRAYSTMAAIAPPIGARNSRATPSVVGWKARICARATATAMMAKRTDSPPTTSHSAMALIETLERHLGPRAGPLAREGADSLDSEAMAAIIASRPVRGKQGSPVDGSRNRAPAWRASKGRPHTGFSRHKGLASLFSLVLRRIRNRWPPCEREPYPRCSTASPRHAGCRESALGPRQRRWAAPCGPSGARFDSRRPNLAVRDLHFRRRPARRRRDVLRRLPGATSSHPDGQARLLFRGPRRRQCLLPLAERIRRPVSIRRIRGDPRRERFPGSNRRPWTLSVDRRRLDWTERLPDHVARCRRRRRTERGRFVPHLGRRNPAAIDQRLRIRSAVAGHLDREGILDDRLGPRGLPYEYRYSRPTIFRHNAYLDFMGHRGETRRVERGLRARTSLSGVRCRISSGAANSMRRLLWPSRGCIRNRRGEGGVPTRGPSHPVRRPLAVPRAPAGLRRILEGRSPTRLHAAPSRRELGRGPRPPRCLGEGRHRQPDVLVQGSAGRGGDRESAGVEPRRRRLRFHGKPRGGDGRRCGEGAPALLRLRPGLARAREAAPAPDLRRHGRPDRRHVRRGEPRRIARCRSSRLGVREYQLTTVLRGRLQDPLVRDVGTTWVRPARRDRHTPRIRPAAHFARERNPGTP